MNRTIKAIKDKLQGKIPKLQRRASAWPALRKSHLKSNPSCTVCGGTNKLEVHHRQPFHLFPQRELDPSNLVTLCESKKDGYNCHLFVGHMGNYSCYNERIDPTIDFVKGWHEAEG